MYKVRISLKKDLDQILYFDSKEQSISFAEYNLNSIFKNFNENHIKYFYSCNNDPQYIYSRTIYSIDSKTKFGIYVTEEKENK